MKQLMTKLRGVAVAALTVGLALGAQAAKWTPIDIPYVAPVYNEIGGIACPSNGISHWVTNSVPAGYTVVGSSASRVTWGAEGATNWYVVPRGTFKIDGGVSCTGHVHLVLCDGAKLTVTNVAWGNAGIKTAASGSFTIYGQRDGSGVLNAISGTYGAGIGGDRGGDGLNITINGGKVMATSFYASVGNGGGAGIGGGADGSGNNISINGGLVTAIGCDDGAGIGGTGGSSGTGGNFKGNGQNITINDGVVTAIGGRCGAGIGGGMHGSGLNITINGGWVTAIGGGYGAGIGGGCGPTAEGSNISIVSGTVFVATAESIISSEWPASNQPNLIGNGGACKVQSKGNSISANARVFFNLTGLYDNNDTNLEQVAAMPTNLTDFTVMTRGTQTVSRVLVGGIGDTGATGICALPWVLTNAVDMTTRAAEVGVETTFAKMYSTIVTNGTLSYVVRDPILTISQQPGETFAYEIKATTDGNDGITNYVWLRVNERGLAYAAVTNVAQLWAGSYVENNCIQSDARYGLVGVAVAVADVPSGGCFCFESAAELTTDTRFGGMLTKTHTGDVWQYRSTPDHEAGPGVADSYVLAFSAKDSFTISNLRYECKSYDMIAEGPAMTQIPADRALTGSNYICRVTYGHEGLFHVVDSEEFTYNGIQIGDMAFAVLHDGTCTIAGTGATWAYEAAGASPLWDYRSAITNVVVLDGVTGIGSRFFENFWHLQGVNLATSVTEVGARAFKKCYGLTNVVSQATGTSAIGDFAFAGCHSLQGLTFAGSPTFGDGAYSFQTAIYMKDGGIPEVHAMPAITIPNLYQHIMGKVNLTDATWTDVTTFTDAQKKAYHFFRIEMNTTAIGSGESFGGF